MATYMLSVHPAQAGEPREPVPTTDTQRGWERIAALEADMETTGVFVLSARLDEPARAKVVRQARTRIKATDGPFLETKEQLGGFYLIEAPDLDAALTWAGRVTEVIGAPIEVRSLAGSRAAGQRPA